MNPFEYMSGTARVVLAGLALAQWLNACSAPEDDNPGYCRLSCTNTTLAAADFKIESGGEAASSYQCRATEAFRMHGSWKITAESKLVDGTSVNVERSGIGFNLSVGNNNEYTVITPDSEWCSDACGVASVIVDGKCDADVDAEYSLELQSGAARSDPIKFTLTMPE